MDTFALCFVFVLAGFLGFELIAKIPSQLHTPLMSGSNAISGATVISAIVATGTNITDTMQTILALSALILATINVVGGYLITNKMLSMFQKKSQ
ncbi:MAG: NAD(P) transhydrogenase subunit alpha [Opitutales bacterium]|nr:NAD(P) transhydrogenase subunit alpha [Opitutales bacterium]